MRVNVSLSLKLTLIVIVLSTITIASVTYGNIYVQEQFFADANYQRASAIIQALNATMEGGNQLYNSEFLSNKTDYFIKQNKDILKITFNLPNEQGELVAYFSTDDNSMKNLSQIEANIDSYKNSNNWYILDQSQQTLTTISPINFNNKILGTYEITTSVAPAYATFNNRVRLLIMISLICMVFMIFSLLFLLSRSIVKPLIKFRDTAKVFGKGNLDTRVNIKSKDELGDLATAFNQMAKDLKESRDKIQDYNQILENLLQQKDEFIGQLGHDLKNPMQPLVGLLPILIEQEKDPKIKEALVIMNQNVEYMQDLIFKTLQLAKLRTSKIKFDFEKLNLRQVVDQIVATEQISLKEHKIDLENKLIADITVNADRLRLSEVFKNLITNSVKYTQEVGGRITIDAKKEEDIVTVSLQDTGIGMTEDQLKKVFDEFYKADVSTNDYHSTGLGLAICKKIVEKHGGKIWAESPGLGKGSIFYFTLKSGDEK